MDHNEIETLIETRNDERAALADIKQVDETTLSVNGHVYVIETNVRNAFDLGEFSNKFNPILTRFDYIVGDWGYGQLRLKGFYGDFRNVSKSLRYSAIPDYLIEDTNFGSNYFILHNLEAEKEKNSSHKSNRKKQRFGMKNKKSKSAGSHNSAKKQQKKSLKTKHFKSGKRGFTIRQK
ncbi:YutD family protein [Fructilactobacillus fructivorans]|uniref:Hypothetical DUF1027 domain protein n=1 Tax=Fructilactobacillus fructivorans TaxID=1614 RepID=A0A0C1Q0X0_9LACO|nr:YutD family protein [Fructilactobacillus fructivorans]KID41528.1 Hypothetical DUF1027 domain protein [Fructilactobacillus fructivorans]MCT0151178.1 DUF1027 domain-containing protein [Fructilactobacillus fructivorans]MCT2867746.1 DUF1027 domain-containing protein [Fructilactobacillus fructivorans]MCT2868737.1 DUF1027 domain-containing protein [Fructilactobacillus fructivorans]MCT2874093.1 DUF1027 domain-containing protein [Fructilactobacillus fructivorans]